MSRKCSYAAWKTHQFYLQITHQGRGKLPEFGKRNTCHHLGNGMFPLLSIWQGIHPRNWSEASHLIYKKHIVDVSPWIQRLLICSLLYDFQVVYVPSKNITVADALSHVSPRKGKESEENFIKLPIIIVNLEFLHPVNHLVDRWIHLLGLNPVSNSHSCWGRLQLKGTDGFLIAGINFH